MTHQAIFGRQVAVFPANQTLVVRGIACPGGSIRPERYTSLGGITDEITPANSGDNPGNPP